MRRAQDGLTLIELMVVVAIVAILAGLASATLNTQKYARTVQGFSDEIVMEMSTARMRAQASGRTQRLVFDEQTVAAYEGVVDTSTGVVTWELLNTLSAPGRVRVRSLSMRTHLVEDDGVPADGTDLPGGFIQFSPDGSATPATVFLSDDRGEDEMRVIVYRATGSAYLFTGW